MAVDFVPKIIYPTGGGTTITFSLPVADDPISEEVRAFNTTSVSQSGAVQNAQDRIEETITVKFRFISKTLTDSVRTWFENSASLKTEFDFYLSKDEAITGTYYLVDDTFEPRRVAPAASNDFLYDFDLVMRRVK